MDYFIVAAILALALVHWYDLNQTHALVGVVAVGFAELAADNW